MISNYFFHSFILINDQMILLMQFFPLKIITGKVNLLSIHTNFAPIELGKCCFPNILLYVHLHMN